MTLDYLNRTIFLYYLGWLAICFVIFAYTSLGEGWRHQNGQHLWFTIPPIVRIISLTFSLLGPSALLIGQDSEIVGCAVILSIIFIPGFFVSFGCQEFSADIQAGTYYTRRGIFGLARKKTGRLDDLKGVQMREVPGLKCFVYIMRPGDKEKGGFQIGMFTSRPNAIAAAEQVSTDLHIPLLPPIQFKAVSGV